ncbi:MAG: hypothetical protein ACAI38_01435 [Myxococcota bacterium]
MLVLALTVLVGSGAAERLDAAAKALAAFERDRALTELEAAALARPLAYDEHVRLYELLGITHAYLGHDKETREAFDMLLALAPGHALAYTLSPKVTFLFEEARKANEARGPTELRMTWPPGLEVTSEVPVTFEVVRDPMGLLRNGRLHYRTHGAASGATALNVALPALGTYAQVALPPQVDATEARALEIFFTAVDAAGNEVLRVGTSERPYTVPLAYEPPPPWYRTWWVWAGAGAVLAVASGIALYLADDPPERLPADVVFR